MRICIISPEYPPHPGSRVATYASVVAENLAAAGNEVHVVTNQTVHASDRLQDYVELWREGNLTVHRVHLLGGDGKPAPSLRFCELNTGQYPDHDRLWAHETSNLVASAIAGFVRSLHLVVGFDVIEVPEHFASAYYIIRHRRAGRRDAYPPVCLIGHTSTRESLRQDGQVQELGRERMRERMLREEYCLRYADGLQTPSQSLMERYEETFGKALPTCRRVIPYYAEVDAEVTPDVDAEIDADGPTRTVTDSVITAQKLELFHEIAADEPPAPDPDAVLPGAGMIVVDAVDVAPELVTATITSIAEAARGASAFRVAVLIGDEPDAALELPASWLTVAPGDAPPWLELDPADLVTWVRAGVRFEHGQMVNLVTMALRSQGAAGAFAWLRPPDIEIFPYAQDGGFHDFLADGATQPVALCVRAHLLADTALLQQLSTPVARCAALVAIATLRTDSQLLHTGSVDGDFYEKTPVLTPSDREQALGMADLLDVLPRELSTTNSVAKLITKTRPHDRQPAVYEPPEMKHLRQVYDEHMRLKNHKVVRMLRSLRLFDLARRVMPGAKKYVGSGKRPS